MPWSVKNVRKCILYGFPCEMDFSPLVSESWWGKSISHSNHTKCISSHVCQIFPISPLLKSIFPLSLPYAPLDIQMSTLFVRYSTGVGLLQLSLLHVSLSYIAGEIQFSWQSWPCEQVRKWYQCHKCHLILIYKDWESLGYNVPLPLYVNCL